MSEGARAVVIGGGLAGAATAWGLARRGHTVTLVEREDRAGVHASGRNAGMIRRIVGDPDIALLAREGARLLTTPPEDLARELDGATLLEPTGSIILAGPEDAPRLREQAKAAQAAGLTTREADPKTCELLGIDPSPGAVAFVTPEDGVSDPHLVLSALLAAARRHGVTVLLGTPASLRTSGETVTGVELEDGRSLDADVVVLAAGAWTEDLAREAGGAAPRLTHYRRHLFYTGPLADVDTTASWVWDVTQGFYVRPESSGLLLCACDEDARPPEDAQVDACIHERLAERVAKAAPRWTDHPLARSWAGLRSFAPDRRFAIGWDVTLRGLYYVTGLGGHGLTVSLALAEPVANDIEGRRESRLRAFDPARFEAVPL